MAETVGKIKKSARNIVEVDSADVKHVILRELYLENEKWQHCSTIILTRKQCSELILLLEKVTADSGGIYDIK